MNNGPNLKFLLTTCIGILVTAQLNLNDPGTISTDKVLPILLWGLRSPFFLEYVL
jgi:hypothetical protein